MIKRSNKLEIFLYAQSLNHFKTGVLQMKQKMSLLLLIMLAMPTPPVFAHRPSGIDAVYDKDSNKLEITVSHIVSDRREHYIRKLSVFKNDDDPVIKFFTMQTLNYQHNYALDIDIKPGDRIKIEALCKKGGMTEAFIDLSSGEPLNHDNNSAGK